MKRRCAWIVGVGAGLLVVLGVWLTWWFNILPGRSYTAEDFGIETIRSETDYDNDGIDDYTDIMLGARKDAENHPRYDGSYVDGGYPADEVGVCTDVIWRAFKEAGYDLKVMVDADILERPEAYPQISQPDPNIDFRRVANLQSFFEGHAEKLTTDVNEIGEWQPGDIVIFDDGGHIGIVSDKRNKSGQPWIIHNAGQPKREEDYLKRARVTGHYRVSS